MAPKPQIPKQIVWFPFEEYVGGLEVISGHNYKVYLHNETSSETYEQNIHCSVLDAIEGFIHIITEKIRKMSISFPSLMRKLTNAINDSLRGIKIPLETQKGQFLWTGISTICSIEYNENTERIDLDIFYPGIGYFDLKWLEQ